MLDGEGGRMEFGAIFSSFSLISFPWCSFWEDNGLLRQWAFASRTRVVTMGQIMIGVTRDSVFSIVCCWLRWACVPIWIGPRHAHVNAQSMPLTMGLNPGKFARVADIKARRPFVRPTRTYC